MLTQRQYQPTNSDISSLFQFAFCFLSAWNGGSAVTWLLAKLASRVSNRVLTKRIPNRLLRWVTARVLILPILIFGIYLVLRVSGLTQLALTVLGDSGLLGLLLGLAFQAIAKNILASIPTTGLGTRLHDPAEFRESIDLVAHRNRKSKTQAEEFDFSKAEGNIKVDTEELKRQADKSWNPDLGPEILIVDQCEKIVNRCTESSENLAGNDLFDQDA